MTEKALNGRDSMLGFCPGEYSILGGGKEGGKLDSASFYVTIALNNVKDSVGHGHRTIHSRIQEAQNGNEYGMSHAIPFLFHNSRERRPKKKRTKKKGTR